LGIYVSGHPLEEYMDVMEQNVTAKSTEFMLEEGESEAAIEDNKEVIVGGMLTEVKQHFTKSNQTMAFVTLEDLYGSVEAIIFPRDYEKNRRFLNEDEKVFLRGRVSVEEEKNAKLIVSDVIPFANLPKTLWVQFETMEDYNEEKLLSFFAGNEGNDSVNIFIKSTRQMKKLPAKWMVDATPELLAELREAYGEENVKTVVGKIGG
jgi:DNA polymerase-3 subunit alpha